MSDKYNRAARSLRTMSAHSPLGNIYLIVCIGQAGQKCHTPYRTMPAQVADISARAADMELPGHRKVKPSVGQGI